ncbi:uncharacterized protein FOMMEDRAFT_28326 [Fomitiporia mediterranea MF3/22]|uniref:uncharacterized protein n=1 Tax=Fomitiporia mediterranea (strain MF3/22) TaxID=694068 RepID=UPI0004407BCA|nr:uncharacterized protein FOMMEDRAFT_28326 [Fomitiporia mediterranea MF3/22]EJD02591.1 hypothetical protein FOMMEDRAFT_28326 [Fomitiporia mediterranea MF3/22]
MSEHYARNNSSAGNSNIALERLKSTLRDGTLSDYLVLLTGSRETEAVYPTVFMQVEDKNVPGGRKPLASATFEPSKFDVSEVPDTVTGLQAANDYRENCVFAIGDKTCKCFASVERKPAWSKDEKKRKIRLFLVLLNTLMAHYIACHKSGASEEQNELNRIIHAKRRVVEGQEKAIG